MPFLIAFTLFALAERGIAALAVHVNERRNPPEIVCPDHEPCEEVN